MKTIQSVKLLAQNIGAASVKVIVNSGTLDMCTAKRVTANKFWQDGSKVAWKK